MLVLRRLHGEISSRWEKKKKSKIVGVFYKPPQTAPKLQSYQHFVTVV